MNTITEKVNQLVNETDCTVEEAMEALDFCEGNYDDALLYLSGLKDEDDDDRRKRTNNSKETYTVNGKDILETMKLLLKEGNITKIRIKKNQETLLNIPVNIFAVGSVLMPYAPIIAAIAALVTDCQIEVERKGDVVVNVNSKIQNAGNKMEEFIDNLRKNK